MQITSSSDDSVDPKFSPDGSRISYVRKHNLYVRAVERRQRSARLTKDGRNLLNGEVDWVYEEELIQPQQLLSGRPMGSRSPFCR